MYQALKLKEVMTRWMGVQKSYEKDVAKKIQLDFADGKIDRLHLPSLDKKTLSLLNSSLRKVGQASMPALSSAILSSMRGAKANSKSRSPQTKNQKSSGGPTETGLSRKVANAPEVKAASASPDVELEEPFQPLILHKVLGHHEILNSKHWRASTECWMCDKWRYTYIFWDAQTCRQYQVQDSFLEDVLRQTIVESNSRLEEAMEQQRKKAPTAGQPYILGTFTDWEPRRMMSIGELCAILQQETKVLNDPDPEAMKQYTDEVMTQLDSILEEHRPYKDAQCIDYPALADASASRLSQNPCKLFVYCDFIKPGKHSYLVNYERQLLAPDPDLEARKELIRRQFVRARFGGADGADRLQEVPPHVPAEIRINMTTYHQIIAEPYMGDYNNNVKTESSTHIRTFNKERSVFKDWKLDRP